MKKLLLISGLTILLILICTIMLNAQVSSWRTNTSQQSQSTQTRVQPSIPQQNNVSSWRTNPPQTPRPNYNIITQPNNWGWQYNNWGWYQPYPYIWYDDFGWRQRSIVHVYETGKRDTIRKEPIYTSFGLGYTNNKQASFWGLIGGKKSYFIMDYVMTYAIDQNSYYPNGNLAIADFPVSKEEFKKESTFYIGGGKRIGKLGIHGMIGFGSEILRYQGKDAIGGISFPKSNTNFTTFKIGLTRDFKLFTIKLDTDPIRGYTQIGIGLSNN